MNEQDLENALDTLADDLSALIQDLNARGQSQSAMQCVGLQASLRSAASVIGASQLVAQFNNDQAALRTLEAATTTLNNNAARIAQQEKSVSVVVGIVNAASIIVGALSPFNLSGIVQGLGDLKNTATL
jgi:hypothetical protein